MATFDNDHDDGSSYIIHERTARFYNQNVILCTKTMTSGRAHCILCICVRVIIIIIIIAFYLRPIIIYYFFFSFYGSLLLYRHNFCFYYYYYYDTADWLTKRGADRREIRWKRRLVGKDKKKKAFRARNFYITRRVGFAMLLYSTVVKTMGFEKCI